MNEPQILQDMPLLLVILLALVGGIFGEMWRADKEGASGWRCVPVPAWCVVFPPLCCCTPPGCRFWRLAPLVA